MPLSLTPSLVPARTLRARAGVAILGCALAAFTLAGCTPEPGAPTTAPSATAGGTATDTPAGTAVPTPTPTPTAAGSPVALECDQVLTPDDIYAFNPNFGAAPDFEPSKGSAASTAVAYEGLACGWMNQTSNELIEVSIAQPNEVLMTQLKDAAIASSQAVPTYGTPPAVEGFFTSDGGQGQAQIFTGKYWVTLTSTVFFEPGDPRDLIETVVSHLP